VVRHVAESVIVQFSFRISLQSPSGKRERQAISTLYFRPGPAVAAGRFRTAGVIIYTPFDRVVLRTHLTHSRSSELHKEDRDSRHEGLSLRYGNWYRCPSTTE
jgi:hypothetical protein